MSKPVEHVTQWIYSGIWGVLTRWFRVPKEPPTLPAQPGESVDSFPPSVGFLRYLKLQFWIAFALIDTLIFGVWIAITIDVPLFGILLAPIALALAVLPDIVVYVAIHLRYDTTWYVIGQRSLRIRRGIWVIHETTITFENVQNVSVRQGPLQRWFGVANVLVETAGGGESQQNPYGSQSAAHQGLIEGIADAPRIRDLVLARLRRSSTTGLGDETADNAQPAAVWRAEHVAALRDIRDAAVTLLGDAG